MTCSKKCILFAGIGGIVPTISRLASTYVTDPSTPMPETGLYFGLLLFFIIGSILACAFSENDIKQAFILGVCAPGIITNIVAGVNDARMDNPTAQLQNHLFISAAYAQNSFPVTDAVYLASTIDRNITINNELLGAGAWESKNIPVYITAIKNNGSKENIGRFYASQKTMIVHVPQFTAALEIRALDRSTRVILPNTNLIGLIINCQIKVRGKNDFLWALGAQRMPKILSIQATISRTE